MVRNEMSSKRSFLLIMLLTMELLKKGKQQYFHVGDIHYKVWKKI